MDRASARATRIADHPALGEPAVCLLRQGVRVRVLASVVGREGLRRSDRNFLAFGDRFETRLIRQAGPRTLEESMDAGWAVLRRLPRPN